MPKKALQDSFLSTPELVGAFNALPRQPKARSGMVPNEWHFELRYIQIEPTPSHVVFFVQPHSRFTHMERLPLGLSSDESGMAFFPDTAQQAAPMIAKSILYAFVNNLGMNKMPIPNPPSPTTPWKLTTEDKELAVAVGAELKRIGVKAKELVEVGITNRSAVAIAQESFSSFFDTIKRTTGLTGLVAAAIQTPEAILFHNFTIAEKPIRLSSGSLSEEEKLIEIITEYCSRRSNVMPPDGTDDDGRALLKDTWWEVQVVMGQLPTRDEKSLKEAADNGDPEATLDYAMRLGVGLACTPDRRRSHEYLVRAAYSSSASKKVKAMAHGLLITWFLDACEKDGTIRSRYLLAASHHCNEAAKLCREVSPKGACASPAVLFFMKNVFEKFSPTVVELNYWYKDAIKALDERNKQISKGQAKMAQKRLKNPHRYRCAAPGCKVQSDTGKMLSQCSGACDRDKKPAYCSKECQKADWKNHKPFCRPGAECSVIDDGSFDVVGTAPSSKSANGALQIPVEFADGKKVLFSSSTMDPQMLKEIRELASKRNYGDGPVLDTIQHVEFSEVD